MNRRWQVPSTYAVDVLIVLAAVVGAVGTASRKDPHHPTGTMLWLEVAAIAVVVLVLLLRLRFPFGAPAATFLVCAALSFADGRLVVAQGAVFVTGMGAALLLGLSRDRVQARVGLGIVLGAAAVIVYNEPGHALGDLLFTPVVFGVAWLVGFALRERRDEAEAAEARAARAERDREAAARLAVAEERARIARELHDIVAHAVSVMVLQVGAVRHRMPPGSGADRDALKNVEDAGRSALAEMRRLLGAMRSDEEELQLQPHPGLADLERLLDDVRAAGLAVRLEVHGAPSVLPPGLDLSAYRILQEGLTNALKHADARLAEVRLRYGTTDLEVEVRDDGSGGSRTVDGLGQGLVGIGERVKIFGGEMSAGASTTGGFVLRARLPLQGQT